MSKTTEKPDATLILEMEKRIRRIEREFDHLMRSAESAEVSVRQSLKETRDEFDRRRAVLAQRLSEAKEAGDAARSELTDGVEAAWNELSDAFNSARSELMKLR